MNRILDGYEAASSTLITRFESISSADLYDCVLDLLPAMPVRVIDIGTGTGRDAAWFATHGHRVLAIEPVDALREAGRLLHKSDRITWLNDTVPELAKIPKDDVFDLIVLSAIWQHLDETERQRTMMRLATLAAPGAIIILSLRHGPGALDRPVHPIVIGDAIASAQGAGFDIIRRVMVESVQRKNRANGVSWTWLALYQGRPPHGD